MDKTYEDGVQKMLRPVRKFGEYTLIDGLHEPLVSEEVWQKAADKLHAPPCPGPFPTGRPRTPFPAAQVRRVRIRHEAAAEQPGRDRLLPDAQLLLQGQ